MRKAAVTLCVSVALSACGENRNPRSPTWPTPPIVAPFGVTGTVFDAIGRPVSGALVTASSVGSQTGPSVSTDDKGEFSFEPVFTTVMEFVASKPGYVSGRTSAIAPTEHLWIRLDSVKPNAVLNGSY